MSDPFMGEIRIWGCNFAPYNWAFCDGQLLPISQYSALFAIIGTYYGGDGRATFALPNFQGGAAMEWGNGAGLTSRTIGEQLGEANVTVLISEMPQHAHTVVGAIPAAGQGATQAVGAPTAQTWLGEAGPGLIYTNASANALFAPQAIGLAGGGLPHPNMQPYETLNFCIALQGIFPVRG